MKILTIAAIAFLASVYVGNAEFSDNHPLNCTSPPEERTRIVACTRGDYAIQRLNSYGEWDPASLCYRNIEQAREIKKYWINKDITSCPSVPKDPVEVVE